MSSEGHCRRDCDTLPRLSTRVVGSDDHSINTFSHPHSKPYTSNTNSKSSCAMPRTWHRAQNLSHMSLSVQPFAADTKQGFPREVVSSIDTLRGEAFFVEHSLIDRTRIQHIQLCCRIQTYFWHHLVHILALHNSHFLSSMFPYTLLRSTLPSGNREHGHSCNSCAHRRNSRADRDCDLQRRNHLFTHIHTYQLMVGNALTAAQFPQPINVAIWPNVQLHAQSLNLTPSTIAFYSS